MHIYWVFIWIFCNHNIIVTCSHNLSNSHLLSKHCLELENVKILEAGGVGGGLRVRFSHSEWIILPLDDLWRHISFSGNRLLTRSGPPAESALLNPI